MQFHSKWITTKDFIDSQRIDVYRKELDLKKVKASEITFSHSYFRNTFNAKSSEKYIINISADDYYKLYVNGRFVCQGPANSYHDTYYYNSVDITPYIADGENAIGIHVYYHGLINRLWNSGDNLQGVIADIFCNGNYFFGTDKTWKYDTAREYIPGKRVGYDTQFIENIDFNMSQPGWNTPDFDDSKYEYAFEKNNDEHIFCEKAEVVDTYTIKPKAVEKLGADHYFVDFGKEYTGQLHMVFNGEKNQKVLLLFGEELQSDNVKQVRYDMRCNCEYKAECTLSGKRDELLFFDYMAFRYAEILTDKDNLDAKSIDMFVRHHRFDKKLSSFKSNNELLNRIWDICTQALMVSVQETYVDCPTREKGQYLGDFIVTGVAHMYLTGDSAMYRKALFDFANSCRICPGMMAVAPGAWMQEIADYSLLYPYAVLKYLQYTNDYKTAEELLPVIDNLMLYFKGYARKDGLLEGIMDKQSLVDWPMNLRDNYDFNLSYPPTDNGCHNVINAYYIGALTHVIKIKELLKKDCRNEAQTLELVKGSFLDEFFDRESGLFTDTAVSMHTSLHSNVLPLLYNIAPKSSHNAIKELIMSKGLCCGVWFAGFVLDALATSGAYNEAFSLLINEGEHSWFNMLKEGATTCFEAWGKEQKWNTSLCHPWASSPVIFLIEHIFGVDAASFWDGELKFTPHIPKGLSAELTLPSSGKGIHIKL